MTSEDNRTPRKRRRRNKRRPGSAEGQNAAPNGNGASAGHQMPSAPQEGGGLGRGRRRRSRHRGRPRAGQQVAADGTPLPMEAPSGEMLPTSGVLYLKANGSGLLVNPSNNYVPTQGDSIVPRSMIERLHLQPGLLLGGSARRAGNGMLELVGLEQVEGMPLEEYRESRRPFSELISIDPIEMFKLETEPERLTTRVLDLLSPLGKGQRCLIVAPPKAGKTTLLKDIAHAVNLNHPDVIVIVLLVDERPEEVTDFDARSKTGTSSPPAPTRLPTITF